MFSSGVTSSGLCDRLINLVTIVARLINGVLGFRFHLCQTLVTDVSEKILIGDRSCVERVSRFREPRSNSTFTPVPESGPRPFRR